MTRFAALLVAMVLAVPAGAQDAAPPASERPVPRLENAPAVPEEAPAVPQSAPAVSEIAPLGTVPLRFPPQTASDQTDSAAEAEAEAGPTIAPRPGQRDLLRLDDAAQASCLVALREMAVVFEEVEAIVPDDDADCGILQPVNVSEIAPGVALVPPAVIRCPTALALAAWVQDFVLPAASRLDDRDTLTAIDNGSGYICRRRNNQAHGALSEHAFGNAFDVMGFRFDQGPPLMVEPRKGQGSLAEAFQNAVRAAACLEFSTVLGPGSNASHDDHLHLDIVARDSGFRLCEVSGAVAE